MSVAILRYDIVLANLLEGKNICYCFFHQCTAQYVEHRKDQYIMKLKVLVYPTVNASLLIYPTIQSYSAFRSLYLRSAVHFCG